jgi:hypothetical protein
MDGQYQFKKNGMSVSVSITEDSVVCTVEGSEVYQLIEKETGKVSLASFQKPQGFRTVASEGKFFAQKFS